MYPAAKGSSKIKTGITAFTILISGAGAGVYAYGESDNNEQVFTAAHSRPDAMQNQSDQRSKLPIHDQKPTDTHPFLHTPHEQPRPLTDIEKKRLIVVLYLWRSRS